MSSSSTASTKWTPMMTLLGSVLVYLLLTQGTFPGLVLCFGGDGHVAIETSHNRFAHATAERRKPCVDVTLIGMSGPKIPASMATSPGWQRPVLVSSIASASFPLWSIPWPSQDLRLTRVSLHPPRAALQTVILLI